MPNLSPSTTLATQTSAALPLFDARRQAAFCEALSHHGNVRLACRAAGISPQTAYRARRASVDFAHLWDGALVQARLHVEEVLADRALNGVEEVVYYHGEEIGRRIRYDNRLLLAHLARLDRLAEQMEARGAVQFDAGLEALAEGRPAAGEGGALTPPRPEPAGEPPLPSLDHRFRAMEAARPADAPPLEALGPWGEVEAVQLAAFEAGEPNWWLAAPCDEEDDTEEEEPEQADTSEPASEWELQTALWNPVPGLCSTRSNDPEFASVSPARSNTAGLPSGSSPIHARRWLSGTSGGAGPNAPADLDCEIRPSHRHYSTSKQDAGLRAQIGD